MALTSSAQPVLHGLYGTARRAFSSNSSSSSASGRLVTGTHVLRIEQYPFLQKEVVPGKAITSAPFTVGEKEWLFHYYPNGINRQTSRTAMAGLELSTRNPLPWDAVAKYMVSIIGRNGKPVLDFSIGVGPGHFDYNRTYYVRLQLFRWLAPRFLDDDGCLNVQCDVTALEVSTAPYKS